MRIACSLIPNYLPFVAVFLCLAGGITGIVLLVKNKKLTLKKSIGLGFLLSLGYIAALVFAATALINFDSWTGKLNTNYRVYGNVYQWLNAPPDAHTGLFMNPANEEMKGKELVPLEGAILSFQNSDDFDKRKPLIKLASLADGTFDSREISMRRANLPTAVKMEKSGFQTMVALVSDATIQGKITIIMVK